MPENHGEAELVQFASANMTARYGDGRTMQRRLFVGSAVIGVTLLAVPAAARPQAAAASSARTPAAVCAVQTSDAMPADGAAKLVVANCRGQGVMLGYADSFEVIQNPRLDAVLVDLRRSGTRRVLLISLHGKERPLIEDLRGDISMRAGKGAMAPSESVEIDLSGFARDGGIAVRKDRAGMASRIALDEKIAATSADGAGDPASE